jgi:tetratricopeptide (TPR) repeat protein
MQDALKDFFISYNSSDQNWAEWIAWQLEEEGYSTILQAWDFRPGSSFVLEMDRATKDARRTIAVLSPNYLKAVYTQPEWSEAFRKDPTGQKGILLPIRVKDCEIRGLLSQVVYIDLVEQDEVRARERLLEGINRGRAKPKNSPSYPLEMQNSTVIEPYFPSGFPTIWNVPYRRNLYFTGREGILERLHNTLTGDRTAELQQVIDNLSDINKIRVNAAFRYPYQGYTTDKMAALTQAIRGLGGIGKTQIAVEYAYRYREDYHAILWVRADSREVLVSDIIAIAKELDLPEKEAQDQSQVIDAVKRWFKNHINWLLIFDNADTPEIIHDYLPSRVNGHILITTRVHSLGEIALSIAIDKMEPEEGALFLLRRAKIISPEALIAEASEAYQTKAKEISALMDGLPLALDQAGAYIEETSCGLGFYLDLYNMRRAELLKRRGSLGFASSHPESVTTTFSLCFDKVQQVNGAAVELLQLCAFLYSDEIPFEIVTEGASYLGQDLELVATNPLELEKAIEELLKFSLVRRNPDANILVIHRLVQSVLKDGMSRDKQRLWAERAVRSVNHVFPNVEFATWPLCQRYILQAQTCVAIIEQWKMEFTEATRLLSQLGIYLRERAQYEDAEKLCNQALTIRKQLLGSEHPDVIKSINDIALLYRAQGKYERAEPLFKQALAIQERILGDEHPEVAEILNNLGLLYHDQEKYFQAEPLHRRALVIWEKVLGLEHPNVARTLNNLAIFYHVQYKYAQAESLLLRALAIYEKAFDSQHPNVSSILNNLGWLYFVQGKFTEAESFYTRALKICEQNLGPEHPNLVPVLYNLAILYSDQTKYEQAESLYCRAIPIYEQIFGSEHLTTVKRLQDLAEIYYIQGKYVEAEPLFKRVLIIYEQTREQNHQDVICCRERIAKIHRAWRTRTFVETEPLPKKLQMIFNDGWWD